MRNSSAQNRLPVFLGIVTLLSVVLLLVWDFFPERFPSTAHDVLGALPLAFISLTYLIYQLFRRSRGAELLKAVLLAAAFVLWAANQFWPRSSAATLLNDLAIALFVVDVFFVIVGWPAVSGDSKTAI